jgi:zinc protease
VADNDLKTALYAASVMGRYATPESVARITLEDVKGYYAQVYRPDDAYLIISGDVTAERGRQLARQLLSGWEPAKNMPTVDYAVPKAADPRRIILVDRPSGEQATIHLGIRAYRNQSQERYAGAVASKILTSGIDSRLGKYVRAEKGLAYGVWGVFSPNRHAGQFEGGTDTSLPTAAEAVKAMFKVFDDMCRQPVTDQELREAKTRVAGGMVMGIQTIGQQAEYRGSAILNDYPIDYYDTYPKRIAEVTAEQVQEVMKRYVKDNLMQIVVVAPAEKVKAQLEELGQVEVIPMPAERHKAVSSPVDSQPSPQTQPASSPTSRPSQQPKQAA